MDVDFRRHVAELWLYMLTWMVIARIIWTALTQCSVPHPDVQSRIRKVCCHRVCTRRTLIPVFCRACRELATCGTGADKLLPFARYVECQGSAALGATMPPGLPTVLVVLIRSYLKTVPSELVMWPGSQVRTSFSVDGQRRVMPYIHGVANVHEYFVFEALKCRLRVAVPARKYPADTIRFGGPLCAAIHRMFEELDGGDFNGPACNAVRNELAFRTSRLRSVIRRVVYDDRQTWIWKTLDNHNNSDRISFGSAPLDDLT